MLNTMIVVKIKNTNYAEWKKLFDGNAEMRANFMRDALVGKVDENTALITADIFDPVGMKNRHYQILKWINVWKKWVLNVQCTCCNLLQYLDHKRQKH